MIKKIALVGFITVFASSTLLAQRRDRNSDYEAKKQELRDMQRQLDEEKREENRKITLAYGTNFLRLSPIKILDIGAVGFGIEYEKLFGQNNMFGVNLPFTVMFDQDIFNDPNYYNTDNIQYNPYFYFTPGFKIYPMGQRKVTYAIGPTVMIGYGKNHDWQWVYANNMTGGYNQKVERNNLRLGLMVMNYVNFQFVKNFSLGIDAGLGVRYYNHYSNPDSNDEILPTGQFSLNFGYRF